MPKMAVLSSLTDRILSESCKKSLASVQEKLRADQYKKSLSSITFQNKVALRRSLKGPDITLGQCIDCDKDLDPLPTGYTGPSLGQGDIITQDFVGHLRYLILYSQFHCLYLTINLNFLFNSLYFLTTFDQDFESVKLFTGKLF